KFAKVMPILAPVLPIERPAGAFYLWTDVGMDDERFTRSLFAAQNVSVLPGSYLARAARGADAADRPGDPHATGPGCASGAQALQGSLNPGAGRVRISLVPAVERCVEAAERMRRFMQGHR